MKKLRNYYFALMAIASLSFLTSCGNDDEDVNPKASITFEPSATNDEVSLAPGADINLKVVVTSADKLKSFKAAVTYGGINGGDTTVTDFPKAGYEFNVDDVVPSLSAGSKIIYTFTATTSKDEVTTRTYTVTVLSDMATYTAKILGNQNATAGSFFASTDGTVYSSADAKTNSAKVDLVYYYSVGGTAATDLATLAAPTDANAQAVYGASTSANIPSWATKNNTEIKKVPANMATLYDQVTSGSQIEQGYMALPGAATKASTLKVGDVIGFMTAAGKHGLAKVTALSLPTTANGNKSEITLSVKVQR